MENKKNNTILSKIKRVLWYPLEDKKLAVLMVLIYLALILPIIYVGKWDAPQLDDYGFASKPHLAWVNTHNLFAVIAAACDTVKEYYWVWQGTFSSIFMMSLSPQIFNYRGYKLVPAIIISAMTLACLCLAHLLLKHCLHRKKGAWITLGAIASILTIEKIYTIPSGLTWYNGAVHYMFMNSVMILQLCTTLRLVHAKGTIRKILWLFPALLFSVGVGGTNYATSLMGILLLTAMCALLFFTEKKRALIALLPWATTLAGLVINITAPGNAIRARNYIGWGKPPIQSILNSFGSAVTYGIEWTDAFTVLVLVLLIPIFWHIMGQDRENMKFRFPLPGIVLLFSFCVMASGFTSSWYSLGHAGLSRLQNAIRMTYQLLLIINEGYFIGWLRRVLEERAAKKADKKAAENTALREQAPGKERGKGTLRSSVFLILVVLMWCTVHFHHNPLGTFTTFSAYYYIRIPQAAWYYNEYMIRREILENSAGQDVVIKEFYTRPWLFYLDDISEDPGDWKNVAMKNYYGLNSVRVEPWE